MTVLVTGSAGFVGFHTSVALKEMGAGVLGLDNVNDYYPQVGAGAQCTAAAQHSASLLVRPNIVRPNIVCQRYIAPALGDLATWCLASC